MFKRVNSNSNEEAGRVLFLSAFFSYDRRVQDGPVFTNGPTSHHRNRLPYIFHRRLLLCIAGASPRTDLQEGEDVSDPGAVYFAEHRNRIDRFRFFHFLLQLVTTATVFIPIAGIVYVGGGNRGLFPPPMPTIAQKIRKRCFQISR